MHDIILRKGSTHVAGDSLLLLIASNRNRNVCAKGDGWILPAPQNDQYSNAAGGTFAAWKWPSRDSRPFLGIAVPGRISQLALTQVELQNG
jgi:hypothetical protein